MGQWVFSVTALAEDIWAVMGPMRQAQEQGDLRMMLACYRQFITRLYEARRLIEAADKYPDVGAFANDLLENGPTGFDLRAVYARKNGGSSEVETLYGQIRHRTVHYMRVGESELAMLLRERARMPARVVVEHGSGRSDVWWQWVHAVTGLDIFGDLSGGDVPETLSRRSAFAANIGVAWTMTAMRALLIHGRRLGIDFERLGELPPNPPPSTE